MSPFTGLQVRQHSHENRGFLHFREEWSGKDEYILSLLMLKSAPSLLALLFALSWTHSPASAQVLDNSFLNGRYGVRQVLIATSSLGAPIDARSWIGILSFNGAGGMSFEGTRILGNGGPAAYRGSGIYSVEPNGFVSMTNPLDPSSSMNLRLGNGMLLGSTTDSVGNLLDLLIAAPLPFLATSVATLSGPFVGGAIEFPNGNFTNVKNAFFRFTPNGMGGVGQVPVTGQTVQNGRRILQQTIAPVSYTLNAEGNGILIFPQTGALSASEQLILGDKQFYVSGNGQFIYGGSVSQGSHDLFIAFRAASGASNQSFAGLFYGAGVRVDQSRPSSYAGASNALGDGRTAVSRRVRQQGVSIENTRLETYSLPSDGVGTMRGGRFALSQDGNIGFFTGTSVSETDNYELGIFVRARALSGSGVFINPAGILNGASFAPTGTPIAPGQFITIFGENLGPENPLVSVAPFPNILGGVSVTIQGRAAPIYFVSRNQMSALVPFATSGVQAEIVVRNGNQESNRVTVPVARTAPGVYSLTQNGLGPGAVLRSDFSVLTSMNPARRGDTILVYLTGLGALNPALQDGAPASTTVLSAAVENVNVSIGGQRATVSFAGAAPGFAGLYQLNVVVPASAPLGNNVPLTIETNTHFHEMVDIAIAN